MTNGNTKPWWEQYGVPVAAAGVLVSMIGLVLTSALHLDANRRQADAAAVSAVQRAREQLREQLIDGGRRFAAA